MHAKCLSKYILMVLCADVRIEAEMCAERRPPKAYCTPVAIAHLPKETEILIRQNLMALPIIRMTMRNCWEKGPTKKG